MENGDDADSMPGAIEPDSMESRGSTYKRVAKTEHFM